MAYINGKEILFSAAIGNAQSVTTRTITVEIDVDYDIHYTNESMAVESIHSAGTVDYKAASGTIICLCSSALKAGLFDTDCTELYQGGDSVVFKADGTYAIVRDP